MLITFMYLFINPNSCLMYFQQYFSNYIIVTTQLLLP